MAELQTDYTGLIWNVESYATGLFISDKRHPGTRHFQPLFSVGHLGETARAVAMPFAALAQSLIDSTDDGPELSACLRKLLEAKDCAVRARLYPGG